MMLRQIAVVPGGIHAVGAAEGNVEACRSALLQANAAGVSLLPVLSEHYRRGDAGVTAEQFACALMQLFYGTAVPANMLMGLAYSAPARADGWSHIASEVAAFVRSAPEREVFVDAVEDQPAAAAQAAAPAIAPMPAPPEVRLPIAARPATPPPVPPGLPSAAINDIQRLLPWNALAGPGDYAISLRFGDDTQAVFVNDATSFAAVKWLFFAMTGVPVNAQSVDMQFYLAMGDTIGDLQLAKDGGAELTMTHRFERENPADLAAGAALVDALDSYADGINPTALLDKTLKFVGLNGKLDAIVEAMGAVWCERSEAALARLSPALAGFRDVTMRLEAYETLKEMHTDVQLWASMILGPQARDSSMKDSQRLDLVKVVAQAGTVGRGETVQNARDRLDALQSTLGALVAGTRNLGGQYTVNRFVNADNAAHMDRYVNRLLVPAARTGTAEDRLPVALMLGRDWNDVVALAAIVALLQKIYPDILQRHRHNATPKERAQDVFEGESTVCGARLVFGGLLNLANDKIKDFRDTLSKATTQDRLRKLRSPLLAAFAVSRPAQLERNLKILTSPREAHYLRADLPPRNAEVDNRGRRRADDINNGCVLRWTRAGVETILNNPANIGRMDADWRDFKAYAARSAYAEHVRLLAAATHLEGNVGDPSERLWTRADKSTLKFTAVVGAAWASAKRHDRRDAMLRNVASKVDIEPLHVWCHNGLAEEICHALSGYEDKLTALTYEPPLPLANGLGQRYNGYELDALNAPELMTVRHNLWTDAERRFQGATGQKHRDDFEDYVDGYEQFLAMLIRDLGQ